MSVGRITRHVCRRRGRPFWIVSEAETTLASGYERTMGEAKRAASQAKRAIYHHKEKA